MESFKNLSKTNLTSNIGDSTNLSATSVTPSVNSIVNNHESRGATHIKQENKSKIITKQSKIAYWSKLKFDNLKKIQDVQFYHNYQNNEKKVALMDTIYEFNVSKMNNFK